MKMLDDWTGAPCVVLSCPGPLRRHATALQSADGLALPQVLLGSESQLLAFAASAAASRDAGLLLFAPFPEMFAGEAGLRLALSRTLARTLVSAGATAAPGTDADVVHLRFGGVRSARVLKGARNAAVLAECRGAPLLTASHHPFASGLVLPAAMQRAYRLTPQAVAPVRSGGAALPILDLPEGLAAAALPHGTPGTAGLEIACLDGFQSDAWAAGHGRDAGACPADGTPSVLVAWNMDHPGSILPELLTRLARLATPRTALPRMILLPFNYIGQTGIIRDLIARVREAAGHGPSMLRQMFLARVRSQDGAAALRRLSRVAWVDGNDPEHWWTLGRLAANDIAPLLIGGEQPGTPHVRADEELRVEAETRYGALIFLARLPSPRQLPALLHLTAGQQAMMPPGPAATPKPARRRSKAAA